jgi:capsular exopolysaccharide synthesis family protein
VHAVPEQLEETQYFGLAELLRVFGRRWRWILGSLVVLTGLALFISLQQEKSYSACTKLLLRTPATETALLTDPNAQVPFFADRQVANQIQVIESAAVQSRVEEAYEGDLSVGDVSADVATLASDAVELCVSSKEPEAAADLANLYAGQYIEYDREQTLDSLEAANAQLDTRIDSVQEERDAVAAPLAAIEQQIADDPGNTALQQERLLLVSELQPDLDALDDLLALYNRTRENLALTAGLAPTDVAAILTPAPTPGDPVSPKPVRDGIVGLMAGIAIGLALALAREFLDQSIRTSDDLERVLKGRYPLLGVIPEVPASEIAVVAGPASHTVVAEAYRALRTSVRFAEIDRPMKVLQITSGSAGEGKTTTAANLARMLTQAGHRVAIADGDLRRPRMHHLLDVPPAPGLAEVVVGERALAEAITQVDALTYVLPAGSSPPNPSELLGSSRAERVIGALAEEMDYTVIDTTPVLAVTDAIVVSRLADATVVVVRARSTTRRELEHTLTALEQASAPIIGLVLNRAPMGDRNTYGYDYGSYDYGKTAARAGTPPARPAEQAPGAPAAAR